jgi:hypothetical protein
MALPSTFVGAGGLGGSVRTVAAYNKVFKKCSGGMQEHLKFFCGQNLKIEAS